MTFSLFRSFRTFAVFFPLLFLIAVASPRLAAADSTVQASDGSSASAGADAAGTSGSIAEDGSTIPADDSSSVDQLFTAPQADTVTKEGGSLLGKFDDHQPITVTGSLQAMGGAVVGVSDGPTAGTYQFGMKPGMSITPSITFDARPDRTFRIHGTATAKYPGDFAVGFSELFFDYTVKDSTYVRVGKQLIGWGITRLFDVGDLMSDSDDGVAAKVYVPVDGIGITSVVLVKTSYGITSDNVDFKSLGYGLQGDVPLGRSEMLFSGFYHDADSTPGKATATYKTSMLGVDLFAEGIGNFYKTKEPSFSGAVAGFYWEKIEPSLKIYGEYYFNGEDSSGTDHRASIVVGTNNIPGTPFKAAIQWTHAFMDNSGSVVPVLSFSPWPHVSMQYGLPVRYGAWGSYYVVNGSPIVQTTAEKNNALSWAQRIGFMFRLTLNVGF